MIQTLYQIGTAIKDDPGFEQYFQPWGNPFPGQEASVIVVEVNNGVLQKITIEVFRNSNIKKYLYKLGSTRGRSTNSVPTVPFIDSEKSFIKFIRSLQNLGSQLIQNNEINKIKNELAKIDISDGNYLLTLKMDGKYLGEIPEMVEHFEENAFETYYKKVYASKESRAKNYICALSGEKSTVYGFVDSLGFTVNDKAFMRNGFDASYSYKMFPVGHESLKILEGMKSLVFTSKFSHRFAGKIKYLILPKFIGSNESIIREVFKLFKDKQVLNFYSSNDKKHTGGFINNQEGLIYEIIEEEKLHSQDILYDILFFEGKQSQLSLYLQLTDVRSSRLEQIIKTKKYIEVFYEGLTNFDDGKKQYIFKINLVSIQNYLLTEQGRKKVPHPFFYKLSEAIFYGQKVDKAIFIRFLQIKFRKAFKELHVNAFGLSTAVKEGFAILCFLEQLNIFSNPNKSNMKQKDKKVKLDALGFIEQHPDFFSTDYKKGAFLFGCLVTRLMYNQPGNAFLKDLNDLSVDQSLIEKKFPKLIAKLRQYGHEFRELEQSAVRYLIDSNKTSKDEISFAVSLGLILQKEFDIKNKKLKEIESDLEVKHEIVEP